MNKSILSLIMVGIALAILHVPHAMLTLGIIACLVAATVQLFWAVLQSFSQPAVRSQPSAVRVN